MCAKGLDPNYHIENGGKCIENGGKYIENGGGCIENGGKNVEKTRGY